MDSSESVHFDLADGTSVAVDGGDVRRVYEGLWALSGVPGAISTAALLFDEASRQIRFRHRIELDGQQSEALRRVLDKFRS